MKGRCDERGAVCPTTTRLTHSGPHSLTHSFTTHPLIHSLTSLSSLHLPPSPAIFSPVMLDFIDSDSDSADEHEHEGQSQSQAQAQAQQGRGDAQTFGALCSLAMQALLQHRRARGGPLAVLYVRRGGRWSESAVSAQRAPLTHIILTHSLTHSHYSSLYTNP